jgi:uncharacterized protein (DUF1330 family)
MTTLLMATIRPRDAAQMAAYGAAAAPTVAAFGGEFLYRAAFAGALLGQTDPHNAAVIRFADADTARAWFNSPAYQALAPLREAAAEMTFTLYDLPA